MQNDTTIKRLLSDTHWQSKNLMILKIHPNGSWPSNCGTSNFICGRGSREGGSIGGGEHFGEGGMMVRVTCRFRIESILLSMVDQAQDKEAWFYARECWPQVSQLATSSRRSIEACLVLCLGMAIMSLVCKSDQCDRLYFSIINRCNNLINNFIPKKSEKSNINNFIKYFISLEKLHFFYQ